MSPNKPTPINIIQVVSSLNSHIRAILNAVRICLWCTLAGRLPLLKHL
jgi:hypothetical protein